MKRILDPATDRSSPGIRISMMHGEEEPSGSPVQPREMTLMMVGIWGRMLQQPA